MLQEKRERRPPTPFQSLVFQAPAFRKEPVHEKKRKLSTCTYETIPPPIKYDYPEETLLLFGVKKFFLIFANCLEFHSSSKESRPIHRLLLAKRISYL